MPVESPGPHKPPHKNLSLLQEEPIRYLILGLIGFVLVLRPLICGSTCGTGINLLLTSFILFAFLVWLTRQISRGEIKLVKISGLGTLLLVWALLILASLTLSPYKFGAFPYVFIWLGDIILFYLLIQYSTEFPDVSRWCLQAFLATAFIITLYALYQYTYGLEELRQTIAQHPDLIRNVPAELKDDFSSRISANEPFATFLYQNSLAAFLVLILPIVTGLAIASRRINLKLIIQVVFIILMIFVLIKTGSRGAWVASLISFLVLIILLIWRHLKKAYRSLILVGGGLILVLGLIIFGLIITNRTPEFMVNISESLRVRFEYWQSAWQTIKHNLWTGVGLNHFTYHYPIYKSAAAGETTHAHNGFLAIWAELGLFGLVTFCSIWLIILIRSSRLIRHQFITAQPPTLTQNTGPVRGNPRSLSLIMILAAGIALALAQALQGTFVLSGQIPWLFPLLFFILWIVFFLLNRLPSSSEQIPTYLRSGILAGVIGFLIHTLVDFNLYEPGLTLPLWFTAGCLIALGSKSSAVYRIRLGSIARVVIPVGSLAIMGIIGLVVTPRLIRQEILLEEGTKLLYSTDTIEVRTGVESIKEASRINPYDARPYRELARIYYRAKPKGQVDEEFESLAQTYIERAITLNPVASPLYFLQGNIWEETARGYRNQALQEKDPFRRKELLRLKDEALQKGVDAFRKTTSLYPTRPENWYRLGRILEESHIRDETRFVYKQALILHNQVTLQRLKFSPDRIKEINQRLTKLR